MQIQRPKEKMFILVKFQVYCGAFERSLRPPFTFDHKLFYYEDDCSLVVSKLMEIYVYRLLSLDCEDQPDLRLPAL